MKRALRIAGGGVLALLLVLALGFAVLQTGPGKAWLAARIGAALSDAQEQVTVGAIEGPVPFDFRVRAVAIADRAGPRLTASDIDVAITASALLAGRLDVPRLAIGKLAMLRPSEQQQQQQGGETDWQSLLHPALRVSIGRFEIGTLELGEPVLGTAMTLTASGSGTVGGGRADATLAVRRIDGTSGEATLALAYGGAPARLHLDAQVSEPTGVVLAGLLQRTDKLPLAVSLSGDGPLADWHGSLHATAGDAASIDASVRVGGSSPYRLSLTAEARAAPLLPPDAARILGDRVAVTSEIEFAQDRISLDRLHVTAAGFGFDADGTLALANQAIAGNAQFDLPDLARLLPSLGGAGTVQATFGGTMAKPQADATLHLAQLHTDALTVADAGAAFRLRPDGDPRTAPVQLDASGTLAGVTLAAGTPPPGLGDRIDWQIAARLDPRTTEIAADRIAITANGASLAGSATAARDGAAGTVQLSIPELAAYDGGALAGALGLAAEFHATPDGAGTAVLSGAIEQPHGSAAQIAALLGPRVTFAGTVERSADGTIAAREIELAGAQVQLAGDGRRAPDDRLDATFQAKLPRLAAIDPQLAGAAAIAGTVAGPSSAPTATATITAPALSVSGVRVDGATAKLALNGLTSLALSLDVGARVHAIAASATARAHYAAGALRVDTFSANAAGARIEGSGRFGGGRIDGKLAGTVADLKPWSELAGLPLAGRLRLDAQAAGDRVTASLEASNLHAGSVALTTAKLGARGDRPGRFDLELAATGTAGANFDIAGSARLSVARGGYDVSVTKLQGTLDQTPVALRAPLAVGYRDGDIRFSGLALGVAGGSLSGEGTLTRSTLALQLQARALQVAALARLGGADVTGKLGFDLSLSGTRAAPRGTFILDGEELRFAAASRPELPALGAVADATWRDGRVEMKGRIAGPQGAAIGWTASAPLVLARNGFAPSLPRDGAVRAHLEGEGELAALADLLPTGEDRLDGHYAIDVSVGGTVGDPDASGRITITSGRYENLLTGAILSGITVVLEGQRDRLVLRQFAADDGAGGGISAKGELDLATADGPELAFSASLRRFRVLNRDEGHASASGDLRLAGPLAAPRLEATLTVDQADPTVPERLPQSARPVAATIIDSANGTTISAPEKTPPSPLLTLALDVQVTIPGKTFVRGRGLDSEWRGRVQITGTAAAPQITGRLEVVRGTYDFLGKNATLSKGIITFSGGTKIDPTIDMEARVASSDVTAIIGISGTAMQPSIKLSSEPALPRDEILSRVLFGTSMSQISAAQGIEIATAAAQLAGGGGFDVLSKIRQGLGLDRLALGSATQSSVVPGIGVPAISAPPGGSGAATGLGTTPLSPTSAPASAGGVGGTTLSAGKYVANGVYVGVNQGLEASSSSVDVSIDVSRHISIDTQAGQASGTGVGINWKLDY